MEGKKEKSVYFPGLNGLRALAALSVLWGHTFQDTFGKWYSKDGHLLQHSGGLFADGVTLFFVISGFLITYLLLKEVEKTDTVNIPKFYMRRILRIWPIYYGYIAVTILVLWWLGEQEQIISNTLWYYIFFAANVPFCSASGLWPIVHYWSIGVEEQFYLFWPWLVRIGKKYILPLASAVLVVWLLCKWGSFLVFGKTFIYRFFGVTRFHCMMLGAIGAVLLYKQNAYFLKIFGNRWITTIAWILFLTSGFYVNYIPAPCRAEFIATISLLLIISQLAPPPIINLENSACDFVGKISYGIYVIHPLLIYLLSRGYSSLQIDLPDSVQIILIYVLVTSLTIGIAWLSYQFYERPFLRLKNRFAVVKSRNTNRQK